VLVVGQHADHLAGILPGDGTSHLVGQAKDAIGNTAQLLALGTFALAVAVGALHRDHFLVGLPGQMGQGPRYGQSAHRGIADTELLARAFAAGRGQARDARDSRAHLGNA